MNRTKLGSNVVLILFVFINSVWAAEEEPVVDKLLGSPLLALIGIIAIDLIALIYHRVRR